MIHDALLRPSGAVDNGNSAPRPDATAAAPRSTVKTNCQNSCTTLSTSGLRSGPTRLRLWAFPDFPRLSSAFPPPAEHPQITAFVIMESTALVRQVRAVQALNLAVPADISVVGDVTNKVAELTSPPLTTINPLGFAIGYEAGKMLIDQLEGRTNDVSQVLMPVRLIIRGSSGPARRDDRRCDRAYSLMYFVRPQRGAT
jgi:DNA-binding LacI/PurR family transcriptional regulator